MFKKFLRHIRRRLWRSIKWLYYHPLIKPWFHPIYTIIRDTINSYNEHRVFRLGAALAYYTIFSLPALIIVVVGLVGLFFGEAAVEGQIYTELSSRIGHEAANQIEQAVINIGTPDTSWWTTMIGIGVLVFVATGVFYALQDTLNYIFGVEPVPTKMKILELIVNRLLSFAMVLSIGGLLLISIVLNALLLKISDFVATNQYQVYAKLPPPWTPYLEHLTDYFFVGLNFMLSVVLITLFFTFLYKILPAVRLRWKYVLAGAFFSAILFSIGQILLGIYISRTNMISAYGAAGSIIAILIWVSYSAQLIFLGAEFIIALHKYRNRPVHPKRFAYALQQASLRPTKVMSRQQLEDLSNHFLTDAPPSYSQLRIMVESVDFDAPKEEIDEAISDIAHHKEKQLPDPPEAIEKNPPPHDVL